jgi:shikimate kinase
MPSIVLIGAPGCGKSSIGKILASFLQVSFTDTDSAISAEQKSTISEIFARVGEAGFREIERSVVLHALATNNGVVALGGGSVLSQEIRQELQTPRHQVFFLEVSLSNAVNRIGRSNDRPLLVVDPAKKWSELVRDRLAMYQECADHTVSTNNTKPTQVATKIMTYLSKDN